MSTETTNVQYRTRRERRDAERAIEAQARVEAFAESLRAARAVEVVAPVNADVNTLEVEVPASFRSSLKSVRTRGSRMFSGRRASGSTVALGLMASTVVLGTGSAAAFAAVASPEAADSAANLVGAAPEADVAEVAPEVVTEEAAATDADTVAASAPKIETTTVTEFDAATVAGLGAEEEVEVEAAGSEQVASSSTASASVAQAGVVWPVGNSSISSYFGARSAPTAGASSWHEGVDFTPGYGAAVGSMAAGTVVAVDYGSTSYGLYIDVEHTINGQTITTRYAHLSSINVSVGQNVAAGETIGNVGNSGVSTGAHLHFEVHVGGSPTDPLAYLQANA